MLSNIQIQSLLEKELREPLSPEEGALLAEWVDASADNLKMYERLHNETYVRERLLFMSQLSTERIRTKVFPESTDTDEKPGSASETRHFPYWQVAAAAMILFIAGIAAYITLTQHTTSKADLVTITSIDRDIAPGKEGATLTLEDGTRMVLDSLGNGTVASQNGSKVILHNGRLTYQLTGGRPGKLAYNMVTTPRGRQFHIVLPDGSEVWLNSASSIKYPTAFSGKERRVEVTGESYFEVAKDAKQPFLINVPGKTEIEVLGTRFNINAYSDEASVNTTLLDGKVRVRRADNITTGTLDVVLSPGQQAQQSSAMKVVDVADMDKVMAWKNGIFNFENVSLRQVLRQLERWYDVDVIYEGKVPDIYFDGKMSRDLNLSEVLASLKQLGVHFRLEEGRKLIVTP